VATELSRTGRPVPAPRLGPEARLALDAALGAAGLTLGAALAVGRTGSRVVAPVARLLWCPPLVPRGLQPRSIVYGLAQNGRTDRRLLAERLGAVLDAWLPVVVEAAVARVDLTALVARHVDLDALVATVDLDRAVALVDLDGAVARVDLDGAVARVDVDAVVRRVAIDQILDRVDIDAIVAGVDLEAIIARVDIDGIVAGVDLDAIVERIDLDEIAARLDVDAVVARADLDAVIARLDLARIAQEVIEEIDLPAIIRDSTGSMASETVRGVRMTGISADDAVARVVDRALFRRRHPRRGGQAP
jgi:hypothetical protein